MLRPSAGLLTWLTRGGITRRGLGNIGPRSFSSLTHPQDQNSAEQFSIFDPSEEHRQLREMMRSFVENEVDPQALQYNREEKFNVELFRKLGELGVLGLTADERFGGAGMDAAAACIVHEELSASDPAFCLSYLAHSQLFVNNLSQNGSEAQKARWLPDTCSGAKIGGMCMSEPAVGTDVLGLRTTAKRTADGSGYVLNGSKMWITNGALSDEELGDVFLVYARTGAPDMKDSQAISLFVVEKGMPGFSLGQRIKDKCGMRASMTAELVFDEVLVPAENLVGSEGGAVICMMRNLEIERVVLAAMGIGLARRCIELTNQYARSRTAFGEPLTGFGQIQKHIADAYADYMAGKSYLYNVAGNMELDAAGQRLDTDAVKLYCTTMSKRVADSAIQVMGGYGYVGEYQVERLWRDSKLLEIGGGTLESHQKNMTRELASVVTL